MNCDEAREALVLGPAGGGPELARHLAGCRACARLAAVERRIAEARRELAGEYPFPLDVRGRVLREIARLGTPLGYDVPAWQLGLAAASALVVATVLAVLAWQGQPAWSAAAHALAGLLRAGVEIASAIGAVALSALGAAYRLLATLCGAGSPLAGIAARLEPLAIAGIGLCYAIMAGTILHVLGRDLRRAVRDGRGETHR